MLFYNWRERSICLICTATVFTTLLNINLNLFYLTIFLLTLHLSLDGSRWQLIPYYIQLLFYLYRQKSKIQHVFIYDVLINILCTSLSIIFCYLFSIPVLLAPQEGSWGCGVAELRLLLRSTSNFSVENLLFDSLVYYPIEGHRFERESRYLWIPKKGSNALSTLFGLPQCIFAYLQKVETHSTMVSPISQRRKKYPIVFFSPDLCFSSTFHTLTFEALACQGYIVVAVQHINSLYNPTIKHGSVKSEFQEKLWNFVKNPFNKFQRFSPLVKLDAKFQINQDSAALIQLLDLGSPPLSRKESLDSIKSFVFESVSFEDKADHACKKRFNMRVAQLRTVYKEMVQLNETCGSWIEKRIDWGACSIMGFGHGALSALCTALSESPLKKPFNSCILLCPNLDNFKVIEQIAARSKDLIPKNFLMITAQQQAVYQKPSNLIHLFQFMRKSTGDRSIIKFNRCTYLDFTDIPLINPSILRWLDLSGPRDPAKTQFMVARVISNFLNHQYKRSILSNFISSQRKSPYRHSKSVRSGNLSASETEGIKTFSLSDVPQQNKGYNVSAALKQRYSPSTLHALRLMGIPEHYLRGLGGITNTAKKLTEKSENKSTFVFDITSGLMQFFDNFDKQRQQQLEKQHSIVDYCICEVCHI